MPEIDIRKKYTYGRRKKKKQNPFIALLSGLFPWKGDGASDVARKLVFLVSVFALTFSCVAILNFYYGKHEETAYSEFWEVDPDCEEKVTVSLPTAIGTSNSSSSGNEQAEIEILEKYKEYWETNPEFVGYLSIDPHINYPVAQSQGDRPNDHYLKYNFNNVPTANGTIFADKFGTFTPTERPHNIIIHGHNLITKNAFMPLTKYVNLDGTGFKFLKDNPLIKFDTLYEPGKYKIFSVFQTNIYENQGEYYDYLTKNYFHSRDDFYEYVTEALDRSRYHTDVDLRYGDELLTLSTCDFSMLVNIRLVIVARRVRYDESSQMDTDKFVNLREVNNGRTADGQIRYKMFDSFYMHVNGGKGWTGVREWDISRVEGLSEYLKNRGSV